MTAQSSAGIPASFQYSKSPSDKVLRRLPGRPLPLAPRSPLARHRLNLRGGGRRLPSALQTNWVHCCCLCLQACLPAPDPQPHARLPLASPTTAKSRLPPIPPPTHLRVRLYLVHVKRWVAGDGADFASRRTSHQRAWRHLSQHSGARRHLQVWQGFCWFGGALAGSCTQVDSLAARCLPLPISR